MRRLSPPASTNRVACMPSIIGPAVRAIDFHVHLPTPEWLDASMKGYVEAAESYFRSKVVRRSLEDLARDYMELDVLAVLLAWDAETATGRPRVPNELVAQACRDHPEAFTGFGSVDPLKGNRAVEELGRISELGLKGVKLHPSLQAFAPDDEKHWPLYERSAPGNPAGRASVSITRAPSGSTPWPRRFPTSKSSPRTSAIPGTRSYWRWPCTRRTFTSTSRAGRRGTSRLR